MQQSHMPGVAGEAFTTHSGTRPAFDSAHDTASTNSRPALVAARNMHKPTKGGRSSGGNVGGKSSRSGGTEAASKAVVADADELNGVHEPNVGSYQKLLVMYSSDYKGNVADSWEASKSVRTANVHPRELPSLTKAQLAIVQTPAAFRYPFLQKKTFSPAFRVRLTLVTEAEEEVVVETSPTFTMEAHAIEEAEAGDIKSWQPSDKTMEDLDGNIIKRSVTIRKIPSGVKEHVLDFEFPGLNFTKSSRMNKRWIVFCCMVGGDLLYCQYTLPSIILSRRHDQYQKACAKLGISLQAGGSAQEKKATHYVQVTSVLGKDGKTAQSSGMQLEELEVQDASVGKQQVLQWIRKQYRRTGFARELSDADLVFLLAKAGFAPDGDQPVEPSQVKEMARWFCSMLEALKLVGELWDCTEPLRIAGLLSRSEAEVLLADQLPGTFIVRLGSEQPGTFVMSYCESTRSEEGGVDVGHVLIDRLDLDPALKKSGPLQMWILGTARAVRLFDVNTRCCVMKDEAFPSKHRAAMLQFDSEGLGRAGTARSRAKGWWSQGGEEERSSWYPAHGGPALSALHARTNPSHHMYAAGTIPEDAPSGGGGFDLGPSSYATAEWQDRNEEAENAVAQFNERRERKAAARRGGVWSDTESSMMDDGQGTHMSGVAIGPDRGGYELTQPLSSQQLRRLQQQQQFEQQPQQLRPMPMYDDPGYAYNPSWQAPGGYSYDDGVAYPYGAGGERGRRSSNGRSAAAPRQPAQYGLQQGARQQQQGYDAYEEATATTYAEGGQPYPYASRAIQELGCAPSGFAPQEVMQEHSPASQGPPQRMPPGWDSGLPKSAGAGAGYDAGWAVEGGGGGGGAGAPADWMYGGGAPQMRGAVDSAAAMAHGERGFQPRSSSSMQGPGSMSSAGGAAVDGRLVTSGGGGGAASHDFSAASGSWHMPGHNGAGAYRSGYGSSDGAGMAAAAMSGMPAAGDYGRSRQLGGRPTPMGWAPHTQGGMSAAAGPQEMLDLAGVPPGGAYRPYPTRAPPHSSAVDRRSSGDRSRVSPFMNGGAGPEMPGGQAAAAAANGPTAVGGRAGLGGPEETGVALPLRASLSGPLDSLFPSGDLDF